MKGQMMHMYLWVDHRASSSTSWCFVSKLCQVKACVHPGSIVQHTWLVKQGYLVTFLCPLWDIPFWDRAPGDTITCPVWWGLSKLCTWSFYWNWSDSTATFYWLFVQYRFTRSDKRQSVCAEFQWNQDVLSELKPFEISSKEWWNFPVENVWR